VLISLNELREGAIERAKRQESRPTSQTFKPTPKDEGKLSLYDGDNISAENAFHHSRQSYICLPPESWP